MREDRVERAEQILMQVKPLAAEYYLLTGKPLGVTGEIAEYIAAKTLGLELAIARTPGYDAVRHTPDGPQHIQIKGRALSENAKPGQRISRIKTDAACDFFLLVLLDASTLDAREMWEAPFSAVKKRLARGGKARERGALSIAEFKNIACRVWPQSMPVAENGKRQCPECGHEFQGTGFGGLDAHWRARHSSIMSYEDARPLVRAGKYIKSTLNGANSPPAHSPSPHQTETAMKIIRSGTQPSAKGPADYFTGTVRIDPLFSPPEPARVAMAQVTFEPGARTAWHTHPLGQTLIVTAGSGRAQRAGGPIETINPGDIIFFPPDEKHWHGAAPTTAMTHIAVQEKLNDSPVTWLEHVSDAQYQG